MTTTPDKGQTNDDKDWHEEEKRCEQNVPARGKATVDHNAYELVNELQAIFDAAQPGLQAGFDTKKQCLLAGGNLIDAKLAKQITAEKTNLRGILIAGHAGELSASQVPTTKSATDQALIAIELKNLPNCMNGPANSEITDCTGHIFNLPFRRLRDANFAKPERYYQAGYQMADDAVIVECTLEEDANRINAANLLFEGTRVEAKYNIDLWFDMFESMP